VLLRANRHELDDMIALAERLGVQYRFDGVLWPRLDGGQGPLNQRLSPAEVVALDREFPERQREMQELVGRTASGMVRAERVYACGAGQRSFHIGSAGWLSACMMARRQSYDLLRGTFQEGWESFLPTVITRRRTMHTRCESCQVDSLCTQCPGWSQAVHGDDETPVDYICELGRLRYAQMVITATATLA